MIYRKILAISAFILYPWLSCQGVMPRLHQRNKLRATCCLKQQVGCNTQLVAGNTQLVAGNKQLDARNMLLVARNKLLVRATCCAGVNAALDSHLAMACTQLLFPLPSVWIIGCYRKNILLKLLVCARKVPLYTRVCLSSGTREFSMLGLKDVIFYILNFFFYLKIVLRCCCPVIMSRDLIEIKSTFCT